MKSHSMLTLIKAGVLEPVAVGVELLGQSSRSWGQGQLSAAGSLRELLEQVSVPCLGLPPFSSPVLAHAAGRTNKTQVLKRIQRLNGLPCGWQQELAAMR